MNVTDSFFQQKPDIKPIIYAYELVGVESHKGYIKVGETTRQREAPVRDGRRRVRGVFDTLRRFSRVSCKARGGL